jgi:hypothetical protein
MSHDVRAQTNPRDSVLESSRLEVQKLLSDEEIEDSDAIRLIFKKGGSALPTILASLREGRNVERASEALAYLGGPAERKVLRTVIASQKDDERKWIMSSFLAGALVEPTSEEDWIFLGKCLGGYKNDDQSIASFSAALALGVNASPRALRLLETAVRPDERTNPENDTVAEAMEAIGWIKQRGPRRSSGSAETDSDSDRFKDIVTENAFFVPADRTLTSFGKIEFTDENRRALVPVEIYRGPKNAQGYNVVLQKGPGGWKIMGVWMSWVA